jgi:uncharacterized protein (DUF2132 family)
MTKEDASDQTPNYQLESTDPARNEQPNNPLHGVKLADILEYLVEMYGWDELGNRINIRCFNSDPSIKSSLKFLRKTQWARDKVERLYLCSIGQRLK